MSTEDERTGGGQPMRSLGVVRVGWRTRGAGGEHGSRMAGWPGGPIRDREGDALEEKRTG